MNTVDMGAIAIDRNQCYRFYHMSIYTCASLGIDWVFAMGSLFADG